MHAYVFAILTVFLWGTAPIFEKRALEGGAVPLATAVAVRSIVIAACAFFASALFTGEFGRGQWNPFAGLPPGKLVLFGLGGLFAGGLGQVTYFMVLRHSDVSLAVPMVASFPLVAALWGALLYKEPLSVPRLVGALLVAAGVALIAWTGANRGGP